MRAIASALAAVAMMTSGALAETPGALAPGKPAGIKQAQIEPGGVLLVAGILALAAVIAVIASTTQGSNSTPSTAS